MPLFYGILYFVSFPRPLLLHAGLKKSENFFKKVLTSSKLLCIINLAFADVAHPVERNLAKVEVASSSLVIRSKTKSTISMVLFVFL